MKLLSKLGPTHDVAESVEESEDVEEQDESTPLTKSRTRMFLQGATVFVVMFVTLRWFLTRNDVSEE